MAKCKKTSETKNYVCKECNFLFCLECAEKLSKLNKKCRINNHHLLELKLSNQNFECENCKKYNKKFIDLIYYCNLCENECYCLNCIDSNTN